MSLTILCDADKCSGCFACVVSCFDENAKSINEEMPAWRSVFQVEKEDAPEIKYFSHACMHCRDAPCVMACPTGAIIKHAENGSVRVNPDLCIGCYSCSLACPFGVPRFSNTDTMQKCTLCFQRITTGLEPACVRVCPTKALKFGRPAEMMHEKQLRAVRNIISFEPND